MKNPFEFTITSLLAVSNYQDIIESVIIYDTLDTTFGKKYYRVCIEYKFKSGSHLSYLSKIMDAGFSNKKNKNIKLTDDEEMYKEFISSIFNFQDQKYVSFDMKNNDLYKLSDLVGDMTSSLTDTLRKLVKVEYNMNTYKLLFDK